MISHTQRFFNPPGLLPPLPFTNPLRGLSRSVDDIHFDLNRNPLPDRQLHDNTKLFYDFKNKNIGNLPYMGKNNIMSRPCYAPYPNMSPLCYKTSPERKDMNTDRSPGLKSVWPMDHVGEYCAELLNRDKHYWTEEETGLMLELYEENKDYFNDNKTKKTKLWSVIANVINKRFSTNVNSEQCSQKYRNLKAEFLKISDPTSLDGGAKKFGRHFVQMKRLIEAEERSMAMKNSPSSTWVVKEEHIESDLQILQKEDAEMQQNNNEMSPSDLRNTQLDIQLTQCPSPMRLEEPHLVNDIQASLTLTSPITTGSPNVLTTPDMMTTKLSLHSDDERRLDLDTSSNEDSDCKFDSPDGSENHCMMDTATNLDHDMRNKNQCLLDNMTQLNQAVHANINNNLRDISPCIEPASEVVLPQTSKREVLINMSTQEAEILKLPRPSLNLNYEESPRNNNPTTTNNQATATTQNTNVKTDGSQGNSLNISTYGNELNEIFNDYFKSRNKELEIYQSKEKQNIVCMNKCIDVFRKIMMEKIN